MVVEQRSHHPFHMYDAIKKQPSTLVEAIQRNKQLVDKVAAKIANCKHLYIVGIGSSYHAAQVGELLMRFYCNEIPTIAFHSFDFSLYGPTITSDDCVIGISHRGNKIYTLNSLDNAHTAGCLTGIITGEQTSDKELIYDVVFQTVPQEKSSAHTISYIASIALLFYLAYKISCIRTNKLPFSIDFLQQDLPTLLSKTFQLEAQIERLAYKLANRRRFWLVGGGFSAITAKEIALKIKETSYLQAEGMSIEAMFHGPFQCAEPDDVFLLIAPAGKSKARVMELKKLILEIDAAYIIVTDQNFQELTPQGDNFLLVPKVPEPFTALTSLLPLQLLTYYLALTRGTNPDGFRLEDSRFAKARGLVNL